MFRRKFIPGDVVEILHPSEIIKTLDILGTNDNLPFMPEMIQYCGKKFKIKSLNEKTCIEGMNSNDLSGNGMREFIFNDVVFLENLRCDGTSHDNCQTGCMIFWKEDWLGISNKKDENTIINQKDVYELRKKLVTKKNNEIYFCQLTQLKVVTISISIKKRLLKLLKDFISGEIKFNTAFKSIVNPLIRKLKKMRSEILIEGYVNKTPVEVLNLQAGEIVEVKSFDEIMNTLDKHGRNKGLGFNLGMKEYCGKRFMVRNRLEKMINESTGKMIVIENSVILDNVICVYEFRGFGCPRARFQIWREIWLRRINVKSSK